MHPSDKPHLTVLSINLKMKERPVRSTKHEIKIFFFPPDSQYSPFANRPARTLVLAKVSTDEMV